MIVLGIDTSCDDTSVGVIQDRKVLANVISSQHHIHESWGGVVPNLAKRAHQENFPVVYASALLEAGISEFDIDVIAVTYGHGLAIALEVGIENAKEIAKKLKRPLVAVQHSEGHIMASFAQNKKGEGFDPAHLEYPVLAILVAGGQTQLIKISAWREYQVIGETVDDAIGEGFDKAARLLGFSYMGGAQLSELAQKGNPQAYTLPRPMRQSGDLNVSYAGLKTAFLKLVQKVTQEQETLSDQTKANLAASYQKAALETLLFKVKKALEQEDFPFVILGGGVAANPVLQRQLSELVQQKGAKLLQPPDRKLYTDNGAMIALAGYYSAQEEQFVENLDELERDPRAKLEQTT